MAPRLDLLPRRLIDARENANLSLRDAEHDTGISCANICRFERGQRVPILTTLVRLARCYGVSVSWLIGESEGKDDADR